MPTKGWCNDDWGGPIRDGAMMIEERQRIGAEDICWSWGGGGKVEGGPGIKKYCKKRHLRIYSMALCIWHYVAYLGDSVTRSESVLPMYCTWPLLLKIISNRLSQTTIFLVKYLPVLQKFLQFWYLSMTSIQVGLILPLWNGNFAGLYNILSGPVNGLVLFIPYSHLSNCSGPGKGLRWGS